MRVKLPTDTTINVTIDASTVYQTIDGFASSDAWDMEYVGKYWSTSNKEAIAKLLFSREVDEKGNSQGIGLSMWRFNLGGGSEELKEMRVALFQIRRNCTLTVF